MFINLFPRSRRPYPLLSEKAGFRLFRMTA